MYKIKKWIYSLMVVAAMSLAMNSAVYADSSLELYEIIEGAPSDSGYIPAFEPEEEWNTVPAEIRKSTPEKRIVSGNETASNVQSDPLSVFSDGELPKEDFSDSEFSDSVVEFADENMEENSQLFPEVFSANSFEEETTENTPFYSPYVSDSLPKKYSLIDVNQTTAVKNQGNLGICWAFSALESIETGLIKKNYADQSLSLSETHLAYCAFHGTNNDANDPTRAETFTSGSLKWTKLGGNKYYSTATLSRRYGPVYDSMYPLNLAQMANNQDAAGSTVSILDSVIEKKLSISRLKNSYWLYEINTGNYQYKSRASRINDVKAFIYHYGAVEIGIKSNSGYDPATNSIFHAQSATPDHSVVLIGWDDTKITAAQQPGAFLLQNSWGTDAGENGYFWVSYEDRSLKSPAFYEMENLSDTQEILHQYDGTGYGSYVNSAANPATSEPVSGANVFTALQNQYLKQVSFYAPASALSYEIKIYRYVDSSPDTGELVYIHTGSNKFAGYYTVSLEQNIPLAAGEKFAVQLTFQNSNGYLPCEKSNNRIYTASGGQSYIYDGSRWLDMMDAEFTRTSDGSIVNYNCNFCIKGIAVPTTDRISIAPPKAVISSVKISNYENAKISWKQGISTVDGYDCVIGTSKTFLSKGKYYRKFENLTGTSLSVTGLEKGTYYAAVSAYRLDANGRKISGEWSKLYAFQVTVVVPEKPQISSVQIWNKNRLSVKVQKTEQVDGHDFVLLTSRNNLAKKKYYAVNKNQTTNSTIFYYLPRGTYYVAVHSYNYNQNGKKVFSEWSALHQVKITAQTPGTVKIQKVKTGKGTLSASYTKANSAYRYEYILTKSKFTSTTYRPSNVYKTYTNQKYKAVSLKNLKKGTWYLGIRAYSLVDRVKVYGKWSVKKIVIR